MKLMLFLATLLTASALLAQSNQASEASSNQPRSGGDQITVRGCISKSGGDFVLMQEDPAVTYQLQAKDSLHLGSYLGQRVALSGTKSPTVSTSEDALNKGGSASPVTITVNSITTLDKECRNR